MTSSTVELSAANRRSMDASPRKNWVRPAENSGGLDPYLREVARGVMRSGKTKSQAIQIAWGMLRRWAAGGSNVSAGTRAKAAKAVAHMERIRVTNKARQVNAAQPYGVRTLDLAADGTQAVVWEGGGRVVELARYVRTAAGAARYGLPIGAVINNHGRRRAPAVGGGSAGRSAPGGGRAASSGGGGAPGRAGTSGGAARGPSKAERRAEAGRKLNRWADQGRAQAQRREQAKIDRWAGKSDRELRARQRAVAKQWVAAKASGTPATDKSQRDLKAEANALQAELRRRGNPTAGKGGAGPTATPTDRVARMGAMEQRAALRDMPDRDLAAVRNELVQREAASGKPSPTLAAVRAEQARRSGDGPRSKYQRDGGAKELQDGIDAVAADDKRIAARDRAEDAAKARPERSSKYYRRGGADELGEGAAAVAEDDKRIAERDRADDAARARAKVPDGQIQNSRRNAIGREQQARDDSDLAALAEATQDRRRAEAELARRGVKPVDGPSEDPFPDLPRGQKAPAKAPRARIAGDEPINTRKKPGVMTQLELNTAYGRSREVNGPDHPRTQQLREEKVRRAKDNPVKLLPPQTAAPGAARIAQLREMRARETDPQRKAALLNDIEAERAAMRRRDQERRDADQAAAAKSAAAPEESREPSPAGPASPRFSGLTDAQLKAIDDALDKKGGPRSDRHTAVKAERARRAGTSPAPAPDSPGKAPGASEKAAPPARGGLADLAKPGVGPEQREQILRDLPDADLAKASEAMDAAIAQTAGDKPVRDVLIGRRGEVEREQMRRRVAQTGGGRADRGERPTPDSPPASPAPAPARPAPAPPATPAPAAAPTAAPPRPAPAVDLRAKSDKWLAQRAAVLRGRDGSDAELAAIRDEFTRRQRAAVVAEERRKATQPGELARDKVRAEQGRVSTESYKPGDRLVVEDVGGNARIVEVVEGPEGVSRTGSMVPVRDPATGRPDRVYRDKVRSREVAGETAAQTVARQKAELEAAYTGKPAPARPAAASGPRPAPSSAGPKPAERTNPTVLGPRRGGSAPGGRPMDTGTRRYAADPARAAQFEAGRDDARDARRKAIVTQHLTKTGVRGTIGDLQRHDPADLRAVADDLSAGNPSVTRRKQAAALRQAADTFEKSRAAKDAGGSGNVDVTPRTAAALGDPGGGDTVRVQKGEVARSVLARAADRKRAVERMHVNDLRAVDNYHRENNNTGALQKLVRAELARRDRAEKKSTAASIRAAERDVRIHAGNRGAAESRRDQAVARGDIPEARRQDRKATDAQTALDQAQARGGGTGAPGSGDKAAGGSGNVAPRTAATPNASRTDGRLTGAQLAELQAEFLRETDPAKRARLRARIRRGRLGTTDTSNTDPTGVIEMAGFGGRKAPPFGGKQKAKAAADGKPGATRTDLTDDQLAAAIARAQAAATGKTGAAAQTAAQTLMKLRAEQRSRKNGGKDGGKSKPPWLQKKVDASHTSTDRVVALSHPVGSDRRRAALADGIIAALDTE